MASTGGPGRRHLSATEVLLLSAATFHVVCIH